MDEVTRRIRLNAMMEDFGDLQLMLKAVIKSHHAEKSLNVYGYSYLDAIDEVRQCLDGFVEEIIDGEDF